MEYIVPLIYLAFVFLNAYYDSENIKFIDHKAEAIVYILGYAFVGVFFFKDLGAIPLIIFPLLTRAAFFDPLFNLLTGNHFLYEGVSKPSDQKSLFDKWEEKIGLPVFAYRIIYFSAYIIYLFYYLLWVSH